MTNKLNTGYDTWASMRLHLYSLRLMFNSATLSGGSFILSCMLDNFSGGEQHCVDCTVRATDHESTEEGVQDIITGEGFAAWEYCRGQQSSNVHL